MKIKALMNRLYEREVFSDRHEVIRMHENLEREDLARERAERRYQEWLEESYPDSKKYGFKSPITDHEKFMWIEGFIRGHR